MLNKKGMTLIEVVVALAILSIGATILYSGFTTVAKMMIDSKVYTENINSQYSALNGKSENGTTLTEDETSITIKYGVKEIVVEGTLISAKSDVDTVDTLNLKKVKSPEFEGKSTIDSVIDDWNEFLINQAMLGNMGARKTYYQELAKQKGLEDLMDTGYWGGFSNDTLNTAYYLEYCDLTIFPKLEKEVVDACNVVYDKDHPFPTTQVEKNVRLGDSQYYIHAYVAFPSELENLIRSKDGKVSKEEMANYVIYYANNGANISKNWNTALVYSQTEKAWYYKRFPTGQKDTDAYIGLTRYEKDIRPSNLFLEMTANPTKWAKIK